MKLTFISGRVMTVSFHTPQHYFLLPTVTNSPQFLRVTVVSNVNVLGSRLIVQTAEQFHLKFIRRVKFSIYMSLSE